MHINTRIKNLEREAYAATNKHTKIEIYIADWCCDMGSSCEKCKNRSKIPPKEIVNGEIVINVGEDRDNY